MDHSFSININPQRLVDHFLNKASEGSQYLLANAKVLSDTADRVNVFLFGDIPEGAFTFSAIGTLAVSQFNPNALITFVGCSILSQLISDSKNGELTEEFLEEKAIDRLEQNHLGFEGEKPIVEEFAEELAEISSMLFAEYERKIHLYDLAQLNLISTAASNILLGNSAPAIAMLTLTSLVRAFFI